MSDTVQKRLNVSDVFTIPYEANKQWSVTASKFTENNIIINVGQNIPGFFNPDTSPQTNGQYDVLLYKSVLANYYPEFYPTSSHSTASYSQTRYWSTNLSTSSYNGFQRLGNGATTEKFFPTASNSVIYTINIPTSLYSKKILPNSFEMQISGGFIYDDGQYNLRYSGPNQFSNLNTVISQSSYVGNIFYEQGLGVLTVIPRSIIVNPPPPPPPPPPVGQTVVLWLSENLAATNAYDLYYIYTDESGIVQSIDFSKSAFAVFSLMGTVIRERAGTGYWSTFSGTPLVQNKQVIPGPLVPQTFTFPANSTFVFAFTAPGSTYVAYTNPPGPGGPGSFVNPTPVTGYAVLGNTNKKGITYP